MSLTRMTEKRLAANRANAQKSTGPRTAQGKARSASNAFQHGLYSMNNYRHLAMHPNLVAATIHNLLEEYQPVTPTEHMLLQQLIHFQLRFLQTEHMCNHYLLEGKHDVADRPYVAVLRELDLEEVNELSFGRPLSSNPSDEIFAALSPDNRLIALLKNAADKAKPVAVFAAAN